jgi:hypothetical protein
VPGSVASERIVRAAAMRAAYQRCTAIVVDNYGRAAALDV